MKYVIVAALVLATCASASAQQRRYYDSRGNSVGTSSTDSQGTTTTRDNRGNTVGRSYRN
jgi:hypothetical protein